MFRELKVSAGLAFEALFWRSAPNYDMLAVGSLETTDADHAQIKWPKLVLGNLSRMQYSAL